ncbi:MAG: acyl-CoA thioesterase [Chloroflexota bacterium]
MEGKTVAQSRITLAQVMGPTDANTMGNVHGGIIMKICDEAGGMAAVRHAGKAAVTVTVDSMRFHSPVHVGNIMFVDACVTWVGRTSIETRVTVRAENVRTGEVTHTNTAYFVYVALDDSGKPALVPPLIPETEEEQDAYDKGIIRRNLRLQLAEVD